MTDTKTLKLDFWKALADSPFLFLQLDSDPHNAVVMTAQLDEDADGAIWFFTTRDHHFATGGDATATFTGKGHDLFARFTGALKPENDRTRIDKHWSPAVEAWYEQGKMDPNMLLMRMDLAQAEIWQADRGLVETAKMLLGFNMREEAREKHVETVL